MALTVQVGETSVTVDLVTRPALAVTLERGTRGVAAAQDIGFSILDVLHPGEYCYRLHVRGDFTPTAVNSVISCDTAPTADATFTITKNGAAYATATILAGDTEGTVTFAGSAAVAPDDILRVYAPASADSTLRNVSLTLAS